MFWKSLLTFLVPPLLSSPLVAGVADRKVLAMGTELRLHLAQTEAAEAALAECFRIEADCSTWNAPSLWSRLNATPGSPVALGEEWLRLLEQMKAWHLCTEGAFSPTLMPLVKAWDLRGRGRTPSPEEVGEALRACDPSGLHLDRETGRAWLEHPGAGVEEGGFLKGYALDQMRRVSGVRQGWLDFGGQVLAWGRGRRVSIADPAHRDRPRIHLRLKDRSLACSGTSERGRHLLDPRTGEPCLPWGAVAVVAPDALTADVLSTALYVLGPERGLRWAGSHGVAAAFLFNHGEVRMTEDFHRLRPTILPLEP